MAKLSFAEVCIYEMHDSDGNCLYVGQTTRFSARENDHRRKLRNGEHHCKSLQDWYDSNKQDKLHFRVIEELQSDPHLLYEREEFWFQKLQPKFWGRRPGMTFGWHDLSDDVKESIFKNRRIKSNKATVDFEAVYLEKVLNLYLTHGKSIFDVSEELSVPYSRVYSVLQERNLIRENNIRQSSFVRSKTDAWLEEELTKRLSNGESFASISKEWGIAASTLGELAFRLGVHIKRKVVRGVLDDYTDEELRSEIEKDYIDGDMSAEALASRWGVSRKTALTTVSKFFPPDGSGNERMRRKLARISDPEEFKRLWPTMSIEALTLYYKCKEGTVLEKAKELGIITNEKNCSFCNEYFKAKRSDAKFCSTRCRNTFHSKERAE